MEIMKNNLVFWSKAKTTNQLASNSPQEFNSVEHNNQLT